MDGAKFTKILLEGFKILLTGAGVLLLLAVLLRLNIVVSARVVTTDGVVLPSVMPYLGTLVRTLDAINVSWKNIFGGHLTLLGLFSSGREVAALAN